MSKIEDCSRASLVEVTNARNVLWEVKKAAPESPLHVKVMKNLTDLLARDPESLDVFCKMQAIIEEGRK